MRRFGTALLLLVPLAALAKWQVFDVPGAGKSAWISDAGDYAVATTTGAYRLDADGGIVERLEVGAMVDAFIDARGCLAAVPNRNGVYILYGDAGCGPVDSASASPVTPNSDDKPVRLNRAHGGPVFLTATDSLGSQTFFLTAPDGTPANGFDAVPSPAFPGKPSSALGVIRSGGTDVALSGLVSLNPPLARIVDGGTPALEQFATTQSSPVELALIDPDTALLTTGAGELVRVAGLGGSGPTWNALTMGGPVHAIGFAPDTDLDHVGLGMAGSTSTGPAAFQFAAPIAGAPGQTWVANPNIPNYLGVAVRADCTADGLCIAVTDAADAGNVVLYTNAKAPSWAPPSQIVTDAGTVVPITVTPTDLDGDPLVVTWEAAAPLTVEPATEDGTSINVTVPESATRCEAPYLDYALKGSLTDGLAAHRDQRTVTLRVQRVFSPLSEAVLSFDAGYQATDAQWAGTVDATGLNCPVERGLGAEVSLSVDGAPQGTQTLTSLPASFAFPRVGCLTQTGTFTATLTQSDGSPGPTLTRTVEAPGQPAGLDAVVGGPLIASCGGGASGSLTAVKPAQACPAQSVTWTQEGGPALTTPTASGESISVQTSDLGLQTLIGQTVSLRLTADSGAGTASLLAQIPIEVVPFIQTHTELEAPLARTDAPLGVRVTVVNPTECPIDGAALVEQVNDAELVPGTARIDGRPAEATLENGALTIPGLDLAPGEPHQVSFDLRPHVLGAPAPTARIVLRGVPISENTSLSAPPTAAGCSCRTSSGGSEALGYLALVGFLLIWRKRHATLRREMRKSIR